MNLHGNYSPVFQTDRFGVTLTEVMVGVLIMAIIIFPSLGVIMNETKVITGTREHTQAAFLAERIIEVARSYNFEKLDQFGSEYQAKDFEMNKVTYRVETCVFTDVKTTDPADNIVAKKLSLVVTYSLKSGKEQKLDVSTIIARHD